MSRLTCILFAVSLTCSACATPVAHIPEAKIPPPTVVYQPTPEPCRVTVTRPTFPDTADALKATTEPADMLKLFGAGWLLAWGDGHGASGYIAELEAAVKGCGGVVAP